MTVIKGTRLKFFIVMAIVVVTIVIAFCASILISTSARNTKETDLILKNIIEQFKKPLPGLGLNELRGFVVKLDNQFVPVVISSNYNETVLDIDEVKQYVLKVEQLKKTKGEIDNLKFLLEDFQGGKLLAFLDVSAENAMVNQLFTTVLLSGGGGITVLLILVWFLSYWIVKPAATALKKQKRFISEAGHELKTPLTVISAGVELLQAGNDDSKKWLKNIKEQVDKMSAMTTELLALSKIDEDIKIVKAEFNLSQTALTESLAFESVAFENGKTLECNIEEGLMYRGNYQAACQAIRILCDNAIKYSKPDKAINIGLKKQASKITFYVSNQSDMVTKEEIPLFFERFYRGSESRGKTSGTGLGLAILKTLADKNEWKLNVQTEQNTITFLITF